MKPVTLPHILVDRLMEALTPALRACFVPKDAPYLWAGVSSVTPDPQNIGYSRRNSLTHDTPEHCAALYGVQTLTPWIGKSHYTGTSAHDKVAETYKTDRRTKNLADLAAFLDTHTAFQCLRAHDLRSFGLLLTPTMTIVLDFTTKDSACHRRIPGKLNP